MGSDAVHDLSFLTLYHLLVSTLQCILCIAARVVILKFKIEHVTRVPFMLESRGLILTNYVFGVLRGQPTVPHLCLPDLLNLSLCSSHARPP